MLRLTFGLGLVMRRVLGIVLLFSALVGAQQKGHSASTFYLEETETQFSVSLARDSNDVYMYLMSPAFSWVSFGFGKEMKDSLMMVAYLSGDGNNVTLSPRRATSHSEPVFDPSIDLEILNGTGVQDSMFVLNVRCSNCRVWPGGFLDAASTAYPMIFAFGPATQVQTDARDAPLRRHVRYGTFTMDMVAASSSDAGVPSPASEAKGVVMQELKKDSDKMGRAHTVIGCLALFVLWPVNIVIAGFVRRMGVHVGFSIFTVVMLAVSYGLGIATSKQYIRSKDFRDPHQIFAFFAIAPLLLMSILPSKPLRDLRPWIRRMHAPLSSLAFFTLVAGGGLGLRLTAQPTPIVLGYVAVALVVAVFTSGITVCVKSRGSAHTRAARRRLEDDEEEMTGPWKGVGGTGHQRGRSAGSWREAVGGGTMPGPQYMMNMHPGVPVYVK